MISLELERGGMVILFEFTPKGKSFKGLWDFGKEAPRLPWNGTFKHRREL
jgi:hypothetical protein